MSRRDVAWPLPARVAVAVVVVLVAGIWVSGGVITNDFGLAMALTAVWMGIAAAACLAIAWRRPGLRVAVIGAYLLTAIVVGGYLGRSMLIDDEVNERVVRATPPAPDRAGGGAAERPRNVLLRRGSFESVAHPAEDRDDNPHGGRRGVLTLTNFEVDNGPDLRVYLVAGPARDESEVDDFEA